MSKTAIGRRFSITLIVCFTLMAAFALAVWTLPEDANWKDWVGNLSIELLRASILIINVQILAQSKNSFKYILVIALSLIGAIGVASSIYWDFVFPGVPYAPMNPWIISDHWTQQTLSFFISAGEFSLSFLLSPDGSRYNDIVKDRDELQSWRVYGEAVQVHIQNICAHVGVDYSAEWDVDSQVNALEKSSTKVATGSERVAAISAVIAENSELIANNKVSINNVRPIVCDSCGRIHDARTNQRKEIKCSCGNVATAEAQIMDIKKKVG